MEKENNVNQYTYYDDEITLKELILKIIEFSKEVFRRKFLIIFFVFIGAGIGFIMNQNHKNTYTSHLSFLLNEEGDNNANAAISAQLGLNSNFSLNKVTEIIKSARVLHKVILTKSIVDGKVDYFGNHIINYYDLHSGWNKKITNEKYKDLDLTDFMFVDNSIVDFKTNELRALSQIQKILLNEIIKISYNDKTSLFDLMVTTNNSDLTSELLNATYNELIQFYTYQTVGKPRENFSVLEERSDSIYDVLLDMERRFAAINDRTKGLKSSTPLVGQVDLKRKYQATTELYIKVSKNKEELDFLLKNKSPEFQILDRTFIPIVNASSLSKKVMIGIFIGLFLGLVYVIAAKIIRDALESE